VVSGTARGCAISHGSLSATSAGTCVVIATKAADGSFNPVSSPGTVVTFAKSATGTPSAAKPGQVVVTFGFNSRALSNSAKNVLINLLRRLVSGASVTIIGYAQNDIPLANSRAKAVEAFFRGLKNLHVTIQIVTDRSFKAAKVVTTAN